MKRILQRVALVLLGTLPLVGAASPGVAEEEFPSEQVALMAGACANCHGTDGRQVGSVPTIAGRPAVVLEARLLELKHDPQNDATIMDRIAKGFSDAELAALAEHFAAIHPAADAAPASEEEAQEQDAP
ncbi:c-type cytochrome [Billgrantia sp. LNSP4103-1]|uniref:c-type cytochrome n=1 Tax=Billgrantia sp. LNSP4103-1 TaxID=3410266 RepID=UPI00403EFB32